MRKNLLLSLFFSLVFLTACKKDVPDNGNTNPPVPSLNDNDHILPGNPTSAQTNATNTTNYLKDYGYYKISYNSAMGTPNWVAWHLQSEDMGSAPRQDDFRSDNTLPSAWYRVVSTSYSGSGFDRGHNCPSADRTSSIAANSSTFYMTNMIPQAPTLNQGPWAGLEDHIRANMVGSSNEAWIFMGNYGNGGGVGSNGQFSVIDNGKVIARGTSDALKKQVGGERLEVVVETQHIAKTIEIVEKVSGHSASLDEGLRLIASPVSTGSAALFEVLKALDAAGIHALDVGLKRPSLDDVFLALTGHVAEEKKAEEAKTSKRVKEKK